ncbi:hypothetical protein NW768_002404 [Fusarium equiseti]|uniref:WW domain-containing protein n=1 Tax=Fusarium equiseti TaxID=61235 RepID=A0ABQ8RN98_FUSEQ|nr:hypothetical protein NW768_002404 [Fusarium equiseti]
MSTFQYQRLDEAADEIRVVTIWPGGFDDPIKIDISHHSLVPPPVDNNSPLLSVEELKKTIAEESPWDAFTTLEGRTIFVNSDTDETSWTHPDPLVDRSLYIPEAGLKEDAAQPVYEALSYTWGLEIATSPLSVEAIGDGTEPSHRGSLCIGKNLDEALRHLRYPHSSRTMWIDALSIDQSDIEERNHEVKRMGDIFRLATRVVAWMGPAFKGSTLALATLKDIAQNIVWKSNRACKARPGCPDPSWHKCDVPPQFNTLTGAAMILISKHDDGTRGRLQRHLWEMARICFYAKGTKLDDLLWKYHDLACQLPHDRIYGLMNLAPPGWTSRIEPDYSKSVLEVYREAFLEYSRFYGRLDLLLRTGVNGVGTVSCDKNWPSWVPDWTARALDTIPPGNGFSAASFSPSHSALHGPNELEVAGIRLDTITYVYRLDIKSFQDLADYFNDLGLERIIEKRYRTGESFLDAHLHVITHSRFKERVPHVGRPEMEHVRQHIIDLAQGRESVYDMTQYESNMMVGLEDSYCFLTNDGYLGHCRTRGTVEKVRILSYGYGPYDGPGERQFDVFDCTSDLRHGLIYHRKNTPLRPLIFVAHCVGGLVLKEVVNYCYYSRPTSHDAAIYSVLKGIIFIGTPHKAEWKPVMNTRIARLNAGSTDIVVADASLDLYTDAKQDHPTSTHIESVGDISENDHPSKVEAVSFLTYRPELATTKSSVPELLATIDTIDEYEAIPIIADHIQMIKLSPSDEGTKQIAETLDKWTSQISN